MIGFIAGLCWALGVYQIMRSATSLPVQMSISNILLVLFLTLLMCNISAVISLQKVMRLDPSEVFN